MKKIILFKPSDSTWKIVIVCHGNKVCIWELWLSFLCENIFWSPVFVRLLLTLWV